MWSKKKIKTEPKVKPKAELEAMTVDLLRLQTGIMIMVPAPRVLISPTVESSKRKSPTPPSCMFALDSMWHRSNLKMCSLFKDQKAENSGF